MALASWPLVSTREDAPARSVPAAATAIAARLDSWTNVRLFTREARPFPVSTIDEPPRQDLSVYSVAHCIAATAPALEKGGACVTRHLSHPRPSCVGSGPLDCSA